MATPAHAPDDVERALRARRAELYRQLAALGGDDDAVAGAAPGGGDDPAGVDAPAGDAAGARLAGALRQLRLRRQLVPLGVIGLLWSAGLVAASNPRAAALYLALAVLVWWRRTRHSPHRIGRRYRTVITVCAGVWLLVATTSGAGAWQTALLVAGGYALAAPYWHRNRIPVPAAPEAETEPAPEEEEEEGEPELPEPGEPWFPEPVEAPELDVVAVRWADTVGAEAGVLAGSVLTGRTDVAGGVGYTIQLVPGRQTTATAKQANPKIASAMSMPLTEVMVLEHPTGQQDLATLLVVSGADNPLAKTNYHPGFETAHDPATGYAGIGIHPDLDWARWAFFIPGWGLAGGGVFGETGSGKSRLLDLLAVAAAHTGVISVWAGDPSGGKSIPGILRHCAWPARANEEILAQLRAMSTAIDLRCALIGLRGEDLHVPTPPVPGTPAGPGILLILDELHKLCREEWWGRAEAVELLTKIAREGRGAAVAVVVADQDPGLPNFGNSREFRTSVLVKNGVCLRLGSSAAKNMMPGLDADPKLLPRRFRGGAETSGLGYLVGELRTDMFRTWKVGDAAGQMAAAPVVDLDEVLAAGIGEPWRNRRALGEQSMGAQAAWIGELAPAVVAGLAAADPALAAALARFRAGPRPAAPGRGPAPATAAPPGTPNVVRFRIPPAPRLRVPAEPAAPEPETAPEPDVLRTPGARRLYELICEGVAAPSDLIARTGLSPAHVHAQIRALAAAGLISKRRHGEWEPAAA